MDNQSWFKYMKEKPFAEKLVALVNSTDSMVRAEYGSVGQSTARDYYQREYQGQKERVNWLFEEPKREHEEAVNGNR